MKLIQITDTHIYRDPEHTQSDINNYTSLSRLLDKMKQTEWPVDAILATGDLSHDASTESYQLLHDALSELNVPVFCLPGNHDDVNTMRAVLDGETIISTERSLLGDWQLIMIDSCLPGEVAGQVSERQLFAIKKHLDQYPDMPALVCIHHPPIKLNSTWLDDVALKTPENLLNMLEEHAQVKALLFGHAHQEYASNFAHFAIYGTPSTCRQFKPECEDFEIDSAMPGYRVLELAKDGSVTTHVKRVCV